MNPALTISNRAPAVAPLAAGLDECAYAGLCLFLFVMPWEAVAHLSGFPLGLWIGSVTFGIAVSRTLLISRVRKLSGVHLWMLGFVALSAISALWTIDSAQTNERIGTYSQLLIAVWLMWELAPSEARLLTLMQAYVWGNVILSALTIRNYAFGRTAPQLETALGTATWDEERYSVTGINENDLGLMLAVCLPLVFYLALRSKGTAAKLIAWIPFPLFVTAILLSGSRGSVVSAAIALMMLPLSFRYFSRSQRIVAGIACFGVVLCSLFLVHAEVWLRLQQFTAEVTEGTLTHRTVIWAAGLASFRDHPWLGIGSGAFPTAVLRLIDIPYVAHNTFLSILVELGIVGEFVWITMLACIAYCILRMRYLERCLWFLVLLSWSVGVMALTWEYNKTTWIVLALMLTHAYARRGASGVEHLARNCASSRTHNSPWIRDEVASGVGGRRR
jgi:O-antigen ligase